MSHSHSHGHAEDFDDPAHFTQEFWDDRHRSAGRLWSGSTWLDAGSWEVIVADAPGRSATDLDGRPVMVRDTVLRAARRPGGPPERLA